jgi:hypothetical protein
MKTVMRVMKKVRKKLSLDQEANLMCHKERKLLLKNKLKRQNLMRKKRRKMKMRK